MTCEIIKGLLLIRTDIDAIQSLYANIIKNVKMKQKSGIIVSFFIEAGISAEK